MKKDVELIEVIKKNDLERVKFLISNGADVNIKNRYGNTPLNTASGFGYFEIVKYLLDKGAEDLNEALIWALINGHLEVVKYLLEKGAYDLNRVLIWASYNGYLEVVKLLIDKGADVNAKDKDNETALMDALKNEHSEVAEFLKSKGAIE